MSQQSVTNPTIKLVVSDIDGTILNSRHQVSTFTKETVQKTTAAGVPFVLASARSPRGMEAIAQEMGISEQPLACYNGALILEDGNIDTATPLFSHVMVPEEARIIVDVLTKKFPDVAINLYSDSDWYVNELDHWVQGEVAITQIQPEVTNLQLLLSKNDFPVHKFLLIGEVADIQNALSYFQQLPLDNSDFYLSKDNYLEITHTGISKERIVTELAVHFGIAISETMALGDNFNDLPMIEKAGVGVAMGNAPLAIQQAADDVTATNDADGVAQALVKYVL